MEKTERILGKLENGHANRKYTLEVIKELCSLFADKIKEQNKEEYSKVDIYHYEKMGKSFAANIIINLFEGDRELFHKIFIEKHKVEYKPINRNIRNNIRTIFNDFLTYLKDNGIKDRNPRVLEQYDMSFYNTVIQDKYKNNRKLFFKDVGLKAKDTGFKYKKIVKITKKIRTNRVKDFIKRMNKRELNTFQPSTISRYSNALSLDLIRHFRTEDGNVDWIFILIHVFKDSNIIKKFRHKTDQNFKRAAKYSGKTDQIEKHLYRINSEELDPEIILIYKEQKEILNNAIRKLSLDEQELLRDFYNEVNVDNTELQKIIEKLKSITF